MADLSDVESALVAQIAVALFPSAYLPGAYTTSNAGLTCKLYRGWPEQTNLQTDLAAGKAHVSIYSDPCASRITTRYERQWQQTIAGVPTLTASVSGADVTFGGTGGAGQ